MPSPSRVLVAIALASTSLLSTVQPGSAQTLDPQTFSPTGFAVNNPAFWNFFQQRGGIRTFGYPVSNQFTLQGFGVQIFQRNVVQLQPDGSVQTLNLLDPGLMPYTRINGSTFPGPDPALVADAPPVSDPNYDTDIIAFVDANAPDVWNGVPVNFGTTFHTTVTFEDAFPDGGGSPSLVPLLNLQIWGAPTSQPAFEPTNRNFIYQRFQRGIMQYDAGCNCTQGLLLADYFKSILTGQDLPPDLDLEAHDSPYYRQYDPTRPLSMARPGDLPGSDLTNAFTPGATSGSPPPAGSTVAPRNGFGWGFQLHLWDLDPNAQLQMAGIVKQAGFNWLKHQVEWQSVETAPGQYDWSQLDNIVESAGTRDLNILFSVVNAPSFYRSADSGLAPADPATFQTFMQALASRYKGQVQAYELWNEENLSVEMGAGNVDPLQYLPLLKAGSTGVKLADPAALTLLGGPSPTGANIPGESMDDLQYLNRLYELNDGEAKAYFDALSAHPSGFAIPPDCTPATPECSLAPGWNDDASFYAFTRVGQYRDTMVAHGDGGKKIWFTEFGYDSTNVPVPGYEYGLYVTEQDQAAFLARSFQKALDLGYVGGMFVWNLNFQIAVPVTDEKWGFGVIRSDWSARPAYSALASALK